MVCDTRHSSHGDSRMLVLLTMCRALYLQVLNSPACTFSRLYLPRRDDLSPSSPFLFLRESGSIPPAPSLPLVVPSSLLPPPVTACALAAQLSAKLWSSTRPQTGRPLYPLEVVHAYPAFVKSCNCLSFVPFCLPRRVSR
jgi:hypothetical protein